MFTTAKRILASGFKGFYRNFTISISALLVLIISLLSFTSIYLALELIKPSVAQLEQKVDINLYFETSAPEEEILKLKQELEAVSQVASVDYVTRAQALDDFKERQDSEIILEALEAIGENPLGAVFNIKATEISQYGEIAAFLESANSGAEYGEVIESINYNQNKLAIEKLNTIVVSVERFGFAASILLAVLAVIITYNTIRLAIYTARNEIRVMRLVGASKFFARGPFLVEGLTYGFVAGVISLGILWPTIYYIAPALQEIFVLDLYAFFLDNILRIGGGMILAGMVLGSISSILAIRRYLNI